MISSQKVKSIIDKVKRLDNKIKIAEIERAKLEGKQAELLKQLEQKFGVKSFEEASKLLSEREKQLVENQELLEEIEEKLELLMARVQENSEV